MGAGRLAGTALAAVLALCAPVSAWAGPDDAAEQAAEQAAQAAERAAEQAADAADRSATSSAIDGAGTAAETTVDSADRDGTGADTEAAGETAADRSETAASAGEQPSSTEDRSESDQVTDDRAEVASGSDDGAEAAETAETAQTESGEAEDTGISSAATASAESLSAPMWKAEIARSQDPEFDRDGYPAQRGEIVALDLGAPMREALAARGFVPHEPVDLTALDARVTKLTVPPGMEALAALDLARSIDRDGTYDLGHFYGLVYATSGRRGERTRLRPARAAAIRNGFAIGVIDTAVLTRGALAGVAIDARDFAEAPGTTPADHGTAIASLLAQEGARQITVANVFRNDGRHSFTSPEAIGRALEWMVERRVAVVNVSLTGPRNAILDALVQRAIDRGTIIVAAAGNGGPTAPPAYPAALPNVVAVTAVDSRQQVYRYANRGSYIRLAALGVAVPAQLPDGTMGVFTGTSFAVPTVAARLAVCATQPTPRNTDCIARLELSAIDLGAPGRDDVYGYGLIR